MAYYIDATKNTAVKVDGKAVFGWNHESRKFDLPVSDPTPKSRMERTSEFEARRFLFEQDPRDCYERITALANKIQERPEATEDDMVTVDRAKAELNAAEAFKEEVSAEVSILQAAVDEYGMAMSDAGKCLASCLKILEYDLRLARNGMEMAKFREFMKKCKSGQCEVCPYSKTCHKK